MTKGENEKATDAPPPPGQEGPGGPGRPGPVTAITGTGPRRWAVARKPVPPELEAEVYRLALRIAKRPDKKGPPHGPCC